MRPLGASCLDSLEDVHLPLHFDPLNLSHGGDEHSSAGHAVTGGRTGRRGGESEEEERGESPLSIYIKAMPIYSLAHDQCPPFGIVLGPLHLPHQLEVGRDGGAAMSWPLQVVEHHYIEGVGMVL